MKTATLQHGNAITRVIVAALVVALVGCASTGPHAPENDKEAAAGTAGGALGAVVGGAGGAAAGFIAGSSCGIAFIFCSPVLAVYGAVVGAIGGGQAGAEIGVNASRQSRLGREAAAVPPELSAPQSANALPSLEGTALNNALVEAMSKGDLTAGPLGVLVIGMSHGAILNPAFIYVADIESATKAVARVVQRDFNVSVAVGPLKEPEQRSAIIWACLISSDGNRTELHFESDGTVGRRYNERVSPTFRSEMKAVMGNKPGYKGGYVCGLQFGTDWPADVRSRIVTFVDDMPPAP